MQVIKNSKSTTKSSSNKVINKQQSITLTKNILLATIGSISYVRMLFPESNFETKGLDGIAIKTLRQNSSIEANQLLAWIQDGCFDALDKQYLKKLVFGIYLSDSTSSDLIEEYEFNFSYPTSNSSECNTVDIYTTESNATTSNHTTKCNDSKNNDAKTDLGSLSTSTRSLIRKLLLLTQSLEPLQENAVITMKLFYHDHTPISYQPPLFKDASFRATGVTGTGDEDIEVGGIKTGYHEISLKVKTKSLPLDSPSSDSPLLNSPALDSCIESTPANNVPTPRDIIRDHGSQDMPFSQSQAPINDDPIFTPDIPFSQPALPNPDPIQFTQSQNQSQLENGDDSLIDFSQTQDSQMPPTQVIQKEMNINDILISLSIVDCDCQLTTSDPTITCPLCNSLAHHKCVGYQSPSKYTCTKCLGSRSSALAITRRLLHTINEKPYFINYRLKIGDRSGVCLDNVDSFLKWGRSVGVFVKEGAKWVQGFDRAFYRSFFHNLGDDTTDSDMAMDGNTIDVTGFKFEGGKNGDDLYTVVDGIGYTGLVYASPKSLIQKDIVTTLIGAGHGQGDMTNVAKILKGKSKRESEDYGGLVLLF